MVYFVKRLQVVLDVVQCAVEGRRVAGDITSKLTIIIKRHTPVNLKVTVIENVSFFTCGNNFYGIPSRHPPSPTG